MAQALIHTGATTVKAQIPWHNYTNYCDIYQNDVDSTDYVYIPYIDKLTPAVSSVHGYTKLFSHVSIDPRILPNLDDATDFTPSGAPADLNNWNVKDDPQPVSRNVRFFVKENKDMNGNVFSTEGHVAYDPNEPAPSGACLNKTIRALSIPIVLKEDGITPATQEDGITYIIQD